MNEYYIAPETDIYVLSGVPLDNTYEHTISWMWSRQPRVEQARYFMSKSKYQFKNCTYERRERLWCKVETKADNLYDCNYMMFRNSAFGDKWFYAFITDVEYVNNNNTRIAFEIDVMQTWLRGINLDYEPEPCFVERCHTATDTMYEHLVPEEIAKGDEYLVDEEIDVDFNDMLVMMCVTEILNGDEFTKSDGVYVSGVFGAITYLMMECKTNSQIDFIMAYIEGYIKGGKENSIVSLQMVPRQLVDRNFGASIKGLTKPRPGQKLGGRASDFYPKNNKLYTYPFNRIKVNNQQGGIKDFAWELFDNEDTRGFFYIEGTHAWRPGAVIYPSHYKGAFKNMEDAVTLENFPVCPWGGDGYLAWWAQNTPSFTLNTLGGIASFGAVLAGLGAATVNPMLIATGVGGMATSVGKIYSSLYASKHQSNTPHDAPNSNLLLPVTKNYRFTITKESLRPEMLQMYDSYFTKFGYARKRVMEPPELNRQRWTYVKTIGFEVNGKLNNRDSKKIAEIYDNGITFWRNPSEVGRYDLPNNPLPQV